MLCRLKMFFMIRQSICRTLFMTSTRAGLNWEILALGREIERHQAEQNDEAGAFAWISQFWFHNIFIIYNPLYLRNFNWRRICWHCQGCAAGESKHSYFCLMRPPKPFEATTYCRNIKAFQFDITNTRAPMNMSPLIKADILFSLSFYLYLYLWYSFRIRMHVSSYWEGGNWSLKAINALQWTREPLLTGDWLCCVLLFWTLVFRLSCILVTSHGWSLYCAMFT